MIALLIPLLPGLVNGILNIVDAVSRKATEGATAEEISAENKAILDGLSARLRQTADQVDAVVLPQKQG